MFRLIIALVFGLLIAPAGGYADPSNGNAMPIPSQGSDSGEYKSVEGLDRFRAYKGVEKLFRSDEKSSQLNSFQSDPCLWASPPSYCKMFVDPEANLKALEGILSAPRGNPSVLYQ